jgi:hypothetical protein
VTGVTRLEIALLLARRTPLPAEIDLAKLICALERSPSSNPQER